MPDAKDAANIAVCVSQGACRTTITIQSPLHSADPRLWKTVAAYALNAIATSRRQSTPRASRKPSVSKKSG